MNYFQKAKNNAWPLKVHHNETYFRASKCEGYPEERCGTCPREAQILPKGGAELVRERFRSCPKEVQIYSERGSFRSCLKEVQIWKYNDDLCKIVFNFFGHDWEAPFWEYECILRLWKTQTKYEVFLPLLCDGRHDSVHESATAEICFYKTSCQSFPLDAIELMHSKWWCHKAALLNL